MIGTTARKLYEQQAKERMKEGGKEAGRGRPKQGQEDLPDPVVNAGQARDLAGKALGVSGRLIDHAERVRKHGTTGIEPQNNQESGKVGT